MMTAADSGFKALFSQVLTSVSNLTLKLDPLSRARLRVLEGISVRFDILTPPRVEPRPLTIRVSNEQLLVVARDADKPNAIVTGQVPDILALLADPASSSRVTIEGDEQVLADLSELLKHFEPDLAGPMGEILGSQAADNLVGMAEAAIAALRSTAESLGTLARDGARSHYLGNTDLADMLELMEDLQLRVDRLGARVRDLESIPGAG
ncbi:MAG: SCP2 sterol-binding domain-containing protein [Pseudomonadales bacterium]